MEGRRKRLREDEKKMLPDLYIYNIDSGRYILRSSAKGKEIIRKQREMFDRIENLILRRFSIFGLINQTNGELGNQETQSETESESEEPVDEIQLQINHFFSMIENNIEPIDPNFQDSADQRAEIFEEVTIGGFGILFKIIKERKKIITEEQLMNYNVKIDYHEDNCIICLDELKEGLKCKSCERVSCTSCLKKWMENANKCPLCQIVYN